ncbi:hypothetical protein D3C71_1887570 [compost metagenome]
MIQHISADDFGKGQVGNQYFLNPHITLYDKRILILFRLYMFEYFVKGEEQFLFRYRL